MTEKTKNILIGGLLAVVLIMAVGYAAFSASLNINGTANITSKWDVHYDTTKTSGAGVVDATSGLSGGTAPSGSISFTNNQAAVISTTLNQPGDSVVYTFTVVNNGSLAATLTQPKLVGDKLTDTSNSITYTVGTIGTTSLAASATTTFTVTVTYDSTATGTPSSTTYDNVVTFSANQAA